ncbi:MAG: GNAT family protein [Candidatus Buchananbacteria bacterium]
MYGPILKGKKIILKPINLKEAPSFVKWFQDEEVIKFLGRQNKGLTLVKEKQYIKKIAENKEQVLWSIYTKDGVHIGSTDLHSLSKENKKTEWGIMIGDKNYWNKGYGQDVLKTIIKYSFNTLKLNRFGLSVYEGNIGGIKCYAKCGLKKEGIKRQSIYRYGRFWDEIIMAMLKSDYKKLK